MKRLLSGLLARVSEPEENGHGARRVHDAGPIWTMVLLDVSGSMWGEKLAQAKKAVEAYFLEARSAWEVVGLTTFSQVARLVVPPDNPAPHMYAQIQSIEAMGGTNLLPALVDTEKLGRPVVGVRKVVVITDGKVDRPDETLAIAAQMRAAGWFFVTRGIPEADEEFLRKLRGPQGAGSYTEVEGLVKAMRDASRLLPGR